ncbi:MAG: molybdopterin oxidoreductase family protein [Rhodospirillales bacterium]|nr:molybdopterin oxidoreductase family protein [Rhodospirillales bacterium]
MLLDENTANWVRSTCPHDCPSACALEVERLTSKRIGKVRGSRANSYTAGVVCAKVARYAERQHHPHRLTQPLLRIGDKGVGQGAYRPISWEEALDRCAESLLAAERRHGSETVWPYYYAGTMGWVQRDGVNRLRHAKRYSEQKNTICTTLAESGWLAGVGAKAGVDAREIAQSDVIVVWGGNPVSTQVNLMTHIAKARKSRGAKLVVVDPYRTPTAEQADMHLMVKPGTDGALAAAVMQILLAEGFADRAYLARMTDWDAGIEAHIAGCTPAWAAAITGLPAAEIVAFAHLYGSTRRSYIRVGYGMSRARNGAAQCHAVSCLPAVTGAWQVEGGGALWGNGQLFGLDATTIMGLDLRDCTVRQLDQSRFGPVLTGDRRDLGEGPPVTALFIQNTNPAVVCPETGRCLTGLAREDLFTIVHEQLMTETAAYADIVLPATTFLEHDDFYTASGHTYIQVTKRVVEPLADCRSNHEVICALAERLGAEHPGFKMTAWELVEDCLRRSGRGEAEEIYRNGGGLDCAEPFEKAHFLKGFPQADGRFHFRPNWARFGGSPAGMPSLPGHWAKMDAATPDKPYRLVTAPARSFLNTSFTETPGSRKREGKPTLLLHPEVCAALDVKAGDLMRMGNDLGEVLLAVRPFDGVQPGVAVCESLWPNSAFPGRRGINVLVSAESGGPRGGAVFHDTAVWIRKA